MKAFSNLVARNCTLRELSHCYYITTRKTVALVDTEIKQYTAEIEHLWRGPRWLCCHAGDWLSRGRGIRQTRQARRKDCEASGRQEDDRGKDVRLQLHH